MQKCYEVHPNIGGHEIVFLVIVTITMVLLRPALWIDASVIFMGSRKFRRVCSLSTVLFSAVFLSVVVLFEMKCKMSIPLYEKEKEL